MIRLLIIALLSCFIINLKAQDTTTNRLKYSIDVFSNSYSKIVYNNPDIEFGEIESKSTFSIGGKLYLTYLLKKPFGITFGVFAEGYQYSFSETDSVRLNINPEKTWGTLHGFNKLFEYGIFTGVQYRKSINNFSSIDLSVESLWYDFNSYHEGLSFTNDTINKHFWEYSKRKFKDGFLKIWNYNYLNFRFVVGYRYTLQKFSIRLSLQYRNEPNSLVGEIDDQYRNKTYYKNNLFGLSIGIEY